MFKVSDLTKIHQKKVLNQISFEMQHGEVGIFLGGSGAGKSTLLRVLNHLEECESGTFVLDGKVLNLAELHQSHTIGMVFQHFNLFEHLNVQDNITLALRHCKGMKKQEAQEIADALLMRYGLFDKADLNVNKLSGGQKQRLAIARTLALDPKIICLDEPTSALDPRLTAQVGQLVMELAAENRIVILTTHDMHLLEKIEGNLFLLEEGNIVERCAKNEVDSLRYPKLHRFLSGT